MSIFYTISVKQTEKDLKTNLKFGLTQKEAQKRLQKYGPNKLPEKKPLSWLYFLLSQFKNPLVYILVIAAVISLLLREFIDFWIIVAALSINVGIGFFQEYKADRTLYKLKKMVQRKARVLRDGMEHEINAEEIVLGDVIFLGAGDKIFCDARLVEIIDFESVEAALTGESLPSSKSTNVLIKKTPLADRGNMVFMGTEVAKGKAKAVVTDVGEGTELGKIALLVKSTHEGATPLQKRFAHLSKVIGIFLAVMVVIIFFIGIFRDHGIYEMLITSIALAVAAIPEGMPAAVAISLALAMQRIFKRRSLVKKLIAAETLGSTNIICTDKTGTLTKGEMAVSEIITWDKNRGDTKSLALKIGLLSNDAVVENPEEKLRDWVIIGDPLEKALILSASGAGLDKQKIERKETRLDEIPFSADIKLMATLHQKIKKAKNQESKNIIYIKGAPEKLMSLSKCVLYEGKKRELTSSLERKLKKQLDKSARKGLRVIAVAYRDTKDKKLSKNKINDLTLVGFIALKDPLRKEAKQAVKLCQQAGIRPIIVTGDHKLTALIIARELGFRISERNVLEGSDVEKMTDGELKRKIGKIQIFARIEPKHKVRIVDAWQKRDQVVAMVGDGVNDAPALKSADIGVAVGSGTDVAKEVSDIVILDNNLATLVAAVEEGRVAFENIQKVTLYLLADAFSEIILIGGALLLGLPLPILAAQILWINLVEDGFPSVALAFEPGEREVMKNKPRKMGDPIVNKEMKILIFAIGIVGDIVLLSLFWWLIKGGFGGLDMDHIRTIVFVALGLNTLFYVFSCRSLRFNIWHKNPFSNKFLVFAVLIGLFFMIGGVYFSPFQSILKTVPLTFDQWMFPLILAFLDVFLIEVTKWVFIVRHKVGS